MRRLLAIIGMVVLGWLGWWAGAYLGVFGGLVLSTIGSGAGLYLGRRIADQYY